MNRVLAALCCLLPSRSNDSLRRRSRNGDHEIRDITIRVPLVAICLWTALGGSNLVAQQTELPQESDSKPTPATTPGESSQDSAKPSEATASHSLPIAKLGSADIGAQDVDFLLGRPSGSPQLSSVTLAEAVQLFAQQRQALQTLRSRGFAAKPEEVLSHIENRGAAQGRPGASSATEGESIAERFAREHSIKPEVYLDQVAFRLSWQRYLAKHLTETNLGRHFNNQKPRFDGTQFRYQLASVPVPVGQSTVRDDAESALLDIASKLEQTETPERTAKFQQLASDRDWILQSPRWARGMGDTDPKVIDALLKLEIGKVSKPFHTATGVHLVQLLDSQAGTLTLDEVRGEVRQHMLLYLLQRLATAGEKDLPLKAIVR